MADERLYAKFTLEFYEHPKIIGLSDRAYRELTRLIMWSRKYLTDGFIRDSAAKTIDPDVLAELCSNDPVKPSLYASTKDGEPGYQLHDFVEHQTEAEKVRAKTEARREAGRKGGLASGIARSRTSTWEANRSIIEANAKQMLEHNGSKPPANTQAKTNTEDREQRTEKRTPLPPAVVTALPGVSVGEQIFDRAWQHWPRKTDRKLALSRFKEATRNKGVNAELLASLIVKHGDAYKAAGTEQQFIPNLSTWIHRERWNDDLPQPPRPGARGSGSGGTVVGESQGWMRRRPSGEFVTDES